jgi:hypothetical protein
MCHKKKGWVVMTTLSNISIGVMHELAITARKAGWEPKDFGDLAKNKEHLSRILPFVRGFSELGSSEHIIDRDDEPFIPRFSVLHQHIKTGKVKWDPANIKLFHSTCKPDKNARPLRDCAILDQVRQEMTRKPVCNANVLDYLLRNPILIPESWKEYAVFFFGTSYLSKPSLRYVNIRYLRWHEVNWEWDALEHIQDWRPWFGIEPVAAIFQD